MEQHGVRAILMAAIGCIAAPVHAQNETLWTHNGSVIMLESKAHNWVLRYRLPRTGMAQAGAQAGDPVFEGWSEQGRVSGTAYIFAGSCGRYPYRADGETSDSRIVLQGQAPVIDRQTCRATRLKDDTLVFERLTE